MRLRLVFLGKTRRPEIKLIIDDYIKRIGRFAPIEVSEVRESEASLKKLVFDRASTLILLDDTGKTFDSEAFAKWISLHRDRGTRELVFICGGADGFPDELRARAHQKLSLSAMTFSHELA
ncbi:MAG: 23S rRNA (pseudouridine(1915)-N(3))-methyltransferase RlmH, partial [Acidobacteriota bacterium]|nr:23S rRNA (pseudouridine(1915)-N(3))-methyltransferase RlmH [Acidobacteriota bacterium]